MLGFRVKALIEPSGYFTDLLFNKLCTYLAANGVKT